MKNRFYVYPLLVIFLICGGGTAFPEELLRIAVVTGGHGYEEAPFREMFDSFSDIECAFVELKDESELFEDITNWSYPAVVLYNMTQTISQKRRDNMIALLEDGVGFIVLHHAIAAFQDWPEYQKIIGAKYWLEKTEENGVIHEKSLWKEGVDMKLHVEDAAHPVMIGVNDFIIHDETYKNYDLEPGNHLLLSCDAPTSQKEVAWARTYRKSKICLIQPGHGKDAYGNEHFRRLLRQAIQWVAMK